MEALGMTIPAAETNTPENFAAFMRTENARQRSRCDSDHKNALFAHCPHLQPSPWMRFNVSTCDNTQVLRWLQVARQGVSPRQAAE
jgi:hypothetical protein